MGNYFKDSLRIGYTDILEDLDNMEKYAECLKDPNEIADEKRTIERIREIIKGHLCVKFGDRETPAKTEERES